MTGPEVSHNSRILTFEDNPASGVQADDNGNMSPAKSSLKPQSFSYSRMINLNLVFGPDSHGLAPETATE